jgi:predicted secreted hydrolase
MKNMRIQFLIVSLFVLVQSVPVLADEEACLSGQPDLGKISLPSDDASHFGVSESVLESVPEGVNDEWWYYNGHLSTPSGHSYGFNLVFFQLEQPASTTGIQWIWT